MNLVSKPSENQFNARGNEGETRADVLSTYANLCFSCLGQDVLPLDNNFPTFKFFPPRSDSVDNSNNRASPINNVVGLHPKTVSPTETDDADFQPISISPFRLFGTTTTVAAVTPNNPKVSNVNTLKKCPSTTDKSRRKRTPKTDDNTDGQKVKRRKSEMTMNHKQLTLTELATSISIEKKTTGNPETSTTKVRRSIKARRFDCSFPRRLHRTIEKSASPRCPLLKVIPVPIRIIHLNRRWFQQQIPNRLK